MKKILLFTAALLCAASMWAYGPIIEGPWTLVGSDYYRTLEKEKIANDSIAYNDEYSHGDWGSVQNWNDDNGFGFNWIGISPANRMRGTFAVFAMQDAVVPPYTSMNVNWAFKLSSMSTKHFSTVCLYGVPCSSDSIQNLKVPFTNRFDQIEDKSTIKGLLAWYYNDTYSKNVKSSDTIHVTLPFDNSAGSTEQTKKWSMMMAFIVGSSDSETHELNESGYFKSLHLDTTWTYFKVFTFDANGGEGDMEQNVVVDDGGSLPTNMYYREGYSFAGWSTTPNGYVVYTDCAMITATAEDKGPQGTLYAVWKEWGHSTKEGPWTQSIVKSHACAKNTLPSISFNEMDNSSWNMASIQNISGEYGIGCAYSGHSVAQSKMGVFSTYRYQVEVPAYARMTMKWRFSLFSKTTKHHATTCLYAGEGKSLNIDTLHVDFSNHYDTQTGKENLLARLTRYDQQGDEGNRAYIPVRNTGFQNRTFTFDNIDGNAPQTKAWYLLLTHVVASGDDPKSGLDEWATFKSMIVDTTWTYRKIVTFNANGGTGEMADQIIDNKGRLTSNTLTREGYSFVGWATANGEFYTDGATITATAEDKGPVTLYAQWDEHGYDPTTNLWTAVGDMRAGRYNRETKDSISYNRLDNTWWGTITPYNDGDSISYKVTGSSKEEQKNGMFSIYSHDETVPAYSRVKLTWTFRLGSKSTKHHSTVCMYGLPDSEAQIKNLGVDFSDDYDTEYGSEYLLAAPFSHSKQDGKTRYADQAAAIIFDNSLGNAEQIKTWYILMTYVMASAGDKDDLNEVGYFKNIRLKKTLIYCKSFTFDANGGTGTMVKQIIDDSGNLKANLFTREGYTFAGWATSANGEKAYDDEELITVTDETKGAVTLYAVWTPDEYAISYQLNGGSASNPETYAVNAALPLNAPTKTGYSFLGWTGSNGAIPQTDVAIAKGSTGNKSFTAHWMSNAVGTTQDLIAAIGEVTIDKGEAIAAARTAYNALSEEDQALVSNNATLTAAEAAYEALAGNTTVNFMQGDTPLGSQKIELDYPAAPPVEGYTFQYWQVVAEDVTAGTIRLQAVYKANTPTDLENVQGDKVQSTKFIKDGNLYILKDEFIYTINGQRVK